MRTFTGLLLAAMFVLQVCAGFAAPFAADIAAGMSADAGCCSANSAEPCGNPGHADAADSCARQCLQPVHSAPTQALSSAFNISQPDLGISVGKVIFPVQPRHIAAAPPRAISSTPLIYHLQRLLN
ncbi:MAG: hypothetical protein ACT4P8_14660 [Betaproteobacteria bacterium]